MSYLSRLKEAEKRPEGEPSKGAKAPSDPFEGSSSGPFPGLAGDFVTGLLQLQAKQAPRIAAPGVWPEVVADAVRLAVEGWAQRALGLGWSPLDLWGASSLLGGDPDKEGLAVKLCGRKLVMLDDRAAIMESQAGTRILFHRRDMAGAALLWELGRGK